MMTVKLSTRLNQETKSGSFPWIFPTLEKHWPQTGKVHVALDWNCDFQTCSHDCNIIKSWFSWDTTLFWFLYHLKLSLQGNYWPQQASQNKHSNTQTLTSTVVNALCCVFPCLFIVNAQHSVFLNCIYRTTVKITFWSWNIRRKYSKECRAKKTINQAFSDYYWKGSNAPVGLFPTANSTELPWSTDQESCS